MLSVPGHHPFNILGAPGAEPLTPLRQALLGSGRWIPFGHLHATVAFPSLQELERITIESRIPYGVQ